MALRAQEGTPWSEQNSARMYDGMPKKLQSGFFLSVWSRNERKSASRSCLDEEFSVRWTISVHGGRRPRDRWVELRDELALKMDSVRALLHPDSLDGRVIRVANVLLAREPTDGTSPSPARRVGFQRGLVYTAMEPIEDKGAAWFGGDGSEVAGFAQAGRLEGARIVQATATAA